MAAIDCGIKKYYYEVKCKRLQASWYIHGTLLMKKFKNKPGRRLLSNGPGNPKDVKPVLELVRKIEETFHYLEYALDIR